MLLTSFMSDAEPAAALADPRLAHEFGQTIHGGFGMTLNRFGNSQDTRGTAVPRSNRADRSRNRAREKGRQPKFTALAYWKFESTPLQRRVCELSVPEERQPVVPTYQKVS